MSGWTAFLIGLGIGTPWVVAAVAFVAWFRLATGHQQQYQDETGTEFPKL
jgi:hypothetical protein